MGLDYLANIIEVYGTNMDTNEAMAMKQGEIDNLHQKIAFLESKLKELESNRSIPRQSWHVSPYKDVKINN